MYIFNISWAHQMCCRQGFVQIKKENGRGGEKTTGGKIQVPLMYSAFKYRPLHLVSCNFNDSSFMNIIEHITV